MSSSQNEISKQDQQGLEIHARMVDRLANLEEQKLALDIQKLEFAKQQDTNGYNYSLKALEIKQDTVKHEHELTEKLYSKLFWFLSFLAFIFVALVIVAFCYNKEQFIYECLKVLVPLVIGWLGGDAYRSKQYEKQVQNKSQIYTTHN